MKASMTRSGYLLAWSLAGLLAACGGGGEEPTQAGTPDQAQAANLIVQADGAGVTTQGSFERAEGYLSRSKRVLRSTGSGPASATFSLKVPRRGTYEVFAWWPQAVADAGHAQVTISHAGGRSQSQVDQRVLGGEWNSLGSFEFDPASGAGLTFESVGPARLLVDAVRLQWVGEQAPALAVIEGALAVGLKDTPYHASLAGRGGARPYRYSVTGGALPPGIELDAASGELSGIAAKAGTYRFEITLHDGAGARASAELEVVIGDTAAGEVNPPGMPLRAQPPLRSRLAESASSAPDLSDLLGVISAMPEGGWSKVNLNAFSSVWTPADLRPLHRTSNPTPSKIILAWSSFAWDSNRATLLLYGGGHANYRGNDVYLWRGTTRMWERASLPSESTQDALGNWNAIDGADKAPASAHTYDNTVFLPGHDRLLVLGGAADANGGHFLTQATATTSRKTGPYLFDPARSHPDRVGGSTGSHVQRVAAYPEIVGGNMWANRESWLNANVNSAPPSESLVNGCTGYANESGQDVAYVRTASRLYRYRILDIGSPAADRWELVGRFYNGSGTQATCSYDTQRKLFVSTNRNTAAPFAYWNLNTPGASNNETYFTPSDPSGEFGQLLASNAIDIRYCAIEFDARRAHHKLWCGDGRVWTLTPPAVPSASGWTITKAAPPTTAVPNGAVGTGILGKWKYIPNLDVFMGLLDPVQGDVWIYKPVGWTNPSGANLLPTVGITAPGNGQSFELGTPISITADASDADGSVVRVEFHAGGAKIGEDTTAPYGMVWDTAPTGNWSLTAVATDDQGAQRTSAAVAISVVPPAGSNDPPTVSITAPADGSTVPFGAPITISADAADSDGTIAKVEFFAGAAKIGESSAAPYTMVWSGAPAGTTSLTAVATDNDESSTVSAAVSITVAASGTGGTVTLQRGTQPGAIVSDLYLSSYHKTLNFGSVANVQDQRAYYSTMLRFAIFQSEGGPVPNGAVIRSAVLSVYKYSSYDMVYAMHRVLQDWSETSATWNQRSTGVAWAVGGANGAGTDYAATADANASTGFNPEWINFDLTASVQAMSSASPTANFGWRLREVSGYTGALKRMHASEYAADPTLRPRLVVTYE